MLFQEDLEILAAGLSGIDCVLSGLAVTGGADMTPAVAKGAVLSNGVLFAVAAADVTITAAHATLPRLDLIVVTNAGALAVRAGTAASAPKPPARSANDVVIAQVYVPAADTAIATTQIKDRRVMREVGPITIKKVTTPVSFNTTSAIQTYFTLTVPDGLFLTGKVIRVRLGGNFLSNSGTPTWTLTISYGGTTMFADATVVTAADADRKPWYVDFDLIAQGTSDQSLVGRCIMATGAAWTAATTGLGDMGGDETLATTPFSGAAAVNSDTGNRDLLVRWTMNVSNVAVETLMEYASAELV